jgi:hypothetical protein
MGRDPCSCRPRVGGRGMADTLHLCLDRDVVASTIRTCKAPLKEIAEHVCD